MVDYDEQQDYFSDGDLATPENIPEGSRCIGKVTKANFHEREAGDGGPQIELEIVAVAFEDGTRFDIEKNYYLSGRLPFWSRGEYAVNSRRALARLVTVVTGKDEEEVKVTPIRDNVNALVGGYITFDVKWRKFTTKDGDEAVAQDFKKIKAATAEQVAGVV